MTRRAAVLLVVVLAAPVAAQNTYKPGRTADGHPDLTLPASGKCGVQRTGISRVTLASQRRGIQPLSLFRVEAPDIPFKEFRIVPIGIFGFYFRAQRRHCLIGRFTLRPQFASTALHETQEA